MSLTVNQAITEVRALVNESAAAFYSDAEITSWLSQAALDISIKTGCVEAISAFNLVASTLEYALPGSFVAPALNGTVRHAALYAATFNNSALVRLHPRMFGQINANTTGNTPQYYALFGPRVLVYPVGSGASGAVRLYSQLTSDSILDLPDGFQHLALTYATYRAKLKDQRYSEAALLFNDYSQAVTLLRRMIIERMPSSRSELTLPDVVQAPVA